MTTSIESLDAATSRVLVGGVEAFRFDTAGITGAGDGKLFGRKNVLGAVSQAAGVPTGAVIERGSNANGQYVRFADGTQVCTQKSSVVATVGTAFLGSHYGVPPTWDFPAAFVSAPSLSMMARGSAHVFCAQSAPSSPTTGHGLLLSVGAIPSDTYSIEYAAFGRWY